MKKNTWLLSAIFCCSLLLAVGCGSLNFLGTGGSDSGGSIVGTGNSAVKFNFAFPSNRHDKRIAGSVRNSNRGELEKFSSIKITPFGNIKAAPGRSASIGNIHIIVPGRPPRNQNAQTFPLTVDEQGNASATIDGLPENTTMVGVISLDGGVASGATDFIGAIHTHDGANDIVVVPPGSLHEVDVTANAVLDVINSNALAEAAPQNLYEPCNNSAQQVLNNTNFEAPGLIPTEVLTNIINTQRTITPASYVHFTENPDNPNAVWGWNNSGRRMWVKENTDLWQPLDLWGTDINLMKFANVLKQGYDGNAYVGWQHSRLSPFGIMKMDLAGGRITFVRNPGKCAQVITLSDNSVVVGGTNDDRRVPVLFRWAANSQGSTYSNANGDEKDLMWCRYFEQEYATALVKSPTVTSMSYDNMKYLTVYVDSPTTPTGYRVYRINILNGDGGPIVDSQQNASDVIVVNKLPRIEFTQPIADNTEFQPGATIQIVASATDKDGVINKIQFMADSQVLETRDITTPAAQVNAVTYDWVGASIGTHTLAIVAFDNNGGSRLASLTVVVLPSAQAPEATLTAPVADAVFTVGETVTITASVTDPDGNNDLDKVEFFNGTILIGSTTSRPFQLAWVPTTSGMANLFVRATDKSGATGDSAEVNILIIPQNQPPASVTITIPTADETDVVLNPVAQASSFWDPDNGDTHQKTLWEIFTDSGLTTKVWSSETTTNLVSVRIDATTGTFSGSHDGRTNLNYATDYWLQARYQDSKNNWSLFSPARKFTTVAAPPPSLVTGIVQSGHNGNALSNVSVTVQKDAYSVSATTNASGVYSLEANPGTGYEVVFVLANYSTVTYQDVTLESGQSLVLDPVTLINPSMVKGNISGTIKDAFTGNALEGVSVALRTGINNATGTFAHGPVTTDGSGLFTFTAIDAGNYTAEVTKSGYVTLRYAVTCVGGETTANQNNTITPDLPEGNWRVVLTWGETPSDLDSHFTGPMANGSRFHVCYWNRTPTNAGANLDVDDVTSYGPETVTVTSPRSGFYRYSVHDFTNRNSSNSDALANSGAVIKVYKGSLLVRTFNVPPESGTLWTVFTLDGDEITPVNRMSYQSNDTVIPSVRTGLGQGGDIDILENLPEKK